MLVNVIWRVSKAFAQSDVSVSLMRMEIVCSGFVLDRAGSCNWGKYCIWICILGTHYICKGEDCFGMIVYWVLRQINWAVERLSQGLFRQKPRCDMVISCRRLWYRAKWNIGWDTARLHHREFPLPGQPTPTNNIYTGQKSNYNKILPRKNYRKKIY